MGQDEDHLLDEIGRFARQQDAEERRRFDERWRRLADGTTSEEDDTALRALAAESEEARIDYEALQPFGSELHERIFQQWPAPTRDAAPPAPAIPGPERVFPASRRRRRNPFGWLGLAAALALAMVGWRWIRGPGEPLPDLPRYSHEIAGGVSELRSPEAPADVSVFGLGSPFYLVLRPSQPVEEEIEKRFYLESPDGEIRKWNVEFRHLTEGGALIDGTLGEDILIDPGDWTVVFIYGRPGSLPAPEKLAHARQTAYWDLIRVLIRILPGPMASTEAPMEVEAAGCLAFFPEPACLPEAGQPLTLWVRVPPTAQLELRVGDALLDEPGVEVDGGRRFEFVPTPEDREVVVRLHGPEDEETWRLKLIEDERPDWLKEANRLWRNGGPADSLDLLEGHREGFHFKGVTPASAALAHGVLARLYMGVDKPEEEVLAHLDEAINLHRQSGDLFNLARDIAVAIYLDYRRQRYPRALERVAELARALPRNAPSEARFHLLQSRAMLQRRMGRFREAFDVANHEITLAERMGNTRQLTTAKEQMALVLQDLGRFGEAHALLQGLESAYERQPCTQARVLNNRAWVLSRAADPGLGDPLPLLARALEIARREDCPKTQILDVLLDQARAFVESGKTWEGIRALEEARTLTDAATPHQHLWWRHVEGLLALQEGQAFEALEHYHQLEELALETLLPKGEWFAKVGQAKSHRLLDDTAAALVALEKADALLDEHRLQVPLHQGRGHFMAQRVESSALHLEILLQAGRKDDALDVARRARARLLGDLWRSHRLARFSAGEHASWSREITLYLRLRDEIEAEAAADVSLSQEGLRKALKRRETRRAEAHSALDRAFRVFGSAHTTVDPPPLRSDEALLVYHPLTEGWVGFAATPDRVETHQFELSEDVLSRDDELTRHLLEPFREVLSSVKRVKILAYGQLEEVDIHALPWNDEVLLASFPVTYGLDIASESAAAPSRRRALVIADPQRDLPAADQEGRDVAAALESSPTAWDIRSLAGEEATPARIRDLAAEVDLLHYAGHGVFAGPFGWESSLLLAGKNRFALGDILSLRRAPATVVLSSCESARAGGDGAAPSLGLAQAFLVAGSEHVVAAMRPVGDQATGDFFRELYREWQRSPSADLAESLRTALLAWRKSDPGADWGSFRLLEP